MTMCGKNNCVKQGCQGPAKSWKWQKEIPGTGKSLNFYVVLEYPGMGKTFIFITAK